MNDPDNRNRLRTWVINDQVGTDGPEEYWFAGEVLAAMTDSWILRRELAGIEQPQAYFPRGFYAVFCNVVPDVANVLCTLS